MEPGTLLHHHQLPLHADYALQPDGDCTEQCTVHAHPEQQHYGHGIAAVESYRRDTPLGQQHVSTPFAYPSAQATPTPRFAPDRGLGESTGYQAPGHFTDSTSTSPSSAASSLAYTNCPPNHYTALQSFQGPVQLHQAFVPSSFQTHRSSSLLDGSPQSMLPPPARSPISTLPNAADRDPFATPNLYATRNHHHHLSSAPYPAFSSYPETPRSVLSATAGLTLSPGAHHFPSHMASTAAAAAAAANTHGYGTQASECANFPWFDLEAVVDMNCEGQLLTPKIHAKVEKGFFATSDNRWTCYRRNYFSVACSFELCPNIANGRITIKKDNGNTALVQAMGMRLSAVVDGKEGKPIELVQHTPKRDAGPKTKIDICKISPTPASSRADQTVSPHGVYQVPISTFHPTGQMPGPYLPMQHTPDGDDTQAGAPQTPHLSSQYPYQAASSPPSVLPGSSTTHTFERVQFKQATANNGKRRATQQFFHLMVELYVDVRSEGSDAPAWVKVAQRTSDRIVVRGRSPSHYQNDKNDGAHGAAGRGGSAGGSGGYSTVGGAPYTGMNAGGFRGLTSAYGSAVNTGGGGGTYRNKTDLPFSDHGGSQSGGSSASSMDEGAVDGEYPVDAVMSHADRLALHEHAGYQYYPSTMYENVHAGHVSKVDQDSRYANDPRQYAVKAEYCDAVPGAQYHPGACGRFHGVPTSRGFYPDLQTSYS